MPAALANAGFTLLELLVVLAIVGMLIAMAPSGLGGLVPGMRLHTAARELADALRGARLEAFATARPVSVAFDAATGEYAAAGTIHSLPAGLAFTLEGMAANHPTITFYPDGSSSSGTVVISRGSNAHRLAVDRLTGRVTLDD